MALSDLRGYLGIGSSKVDIAQPYTGPIDFYEDFKGSLTSFASATADAEKYRLGGVGTNAINATEDTDGGGVTFTTGATDNNELGYQLNGSGFFCTARTTSTPARQMRTGIRFSISSISASSFLFGMFAKDLVTTTGPTSPLTTASQYGIGLAVVNGVVQYVSKGSVAQAITTITGAPAVVAATLYNWEIQMDQNNVFSFWINGTKYLSISGTTTPLSATVGLSPCFTVKTTGGSAAKGVTLQRWFAAVEPPLAGW